MERDFDKALAGFLVRAQAIVDEGYHVYKHTNTPKLETMVGRRYIRVVTVDGESRSAYCFVDRTSGDILKAGSWKAPAKGIRGNIFDEHNGAEAVTAYGTICFR